MHISRWHCMALLSPSEREKFLAIKILIRPVRLPTNAEERRENWKAIDEALKKLWRQPDASGIEEAGED